MGDIEEEEDFEAFEMRQMAEDAVKNQEQEEYDRNHGGEDRSGDSGNSEYDDEYDDEELQRDENGELLDDDYDGNQTTNASGSPDGDNLSRAKLSRKDYVKRAQSAKS